jgi:hypothetical protein
LGHGGYFRDLRRPHITPKPLRIWHTLMLETKFSAHSPQGLGTMTPASAQSESPRRMTRVRVKIPLRLATLAPAPLFAEETHTLVVNPQGCGVKLSRALDPGTRILLDGLPGGAQATARVANCLPLGAGGKYFLLGLALETIGNVWGITSPPADWGSADGPVVAPAAAAEDPIKKKNWPYSLFSQKGEAHPGRR